MAAVSAIAYTAQLGDVPAEWLSMVAARRTCEVITGTGLGIVWDRFPQTLDEAISTGLSEQLSM